MSRSPEDVVAARRATRYRLEYPEALPISAARDEIVAAIKEHRVVVVCGDTGSGKTTQLPKLCLEAGRGVEGMIGHTPSRRKRLRAGSRPSSTCASAMRSVSRCGSRIERARRRS